MYIPPVMNAKAGIFQNQILYEENMMDDLKIQDSDSVLDVGCGRGLVAIHVSKRKRAHVTGINIDKSQIQYGSKMNDIGYSDINCDFLVVDFNRLPLPFCDNQFNAIYQIQAFTYAEDLPLLFKELSRVLKPKGRIACLDWIKLPQYDSKDPLHQLILKNTKPVLGAMNTWSEEEYLDAMRPYFTILRHENLSKDGLQSPLIEKAHSFFTKLNKMVQKGIYYKIVPKHVGQLLARLTSGGDAFIQGDKMRLFTTSFYVLAEKK